MTDLLMPKLGADMTAGTLVTWYKRPGDVVQRGDVVAAVDTDKGVIDIEVFSDGTLEALVVQPGEKAPVGAVLATVRKEGAPPSASVEPLPAPTAVRTAISPAARRRARELGVDPTMVRGTGSGGAITREDVERAAGAAPVGISPPPSIAAPPTAVSPAERGARMRQAIAAAMTQSKREIPHYYLGTTIDMHAALDWLTRTNASRPIADRLLYGVLLLKGVALALREVPELNAWWVNGRAESREGVHVGVAISLREGGLIAPALRDADRQSVDELMRNFRELVSRARGGSLRGSELSDATITVTSLGEQGVETVWGIIYPPQVALVGFGKIVERPWSVGGQVVSRPVLTATLSGDHRASDGHRGGRFLAAIDRLLQEPEKL